VMLAAASLTSVITSSWTTDRRRAADAIAEHYPQWSDQAPSRRSGPGHRPMIPRRYARSSTASPPGSPKNCVTRLRPR
jgi:hypothetical protein